MYLSLKDYSEYGGQLNKSDFERYEYRAEKILDIYTQNRLRDVTYDNICEEVKRCVFELINYIADNLLGGDIRTVQSDGNDGVSTSYESKTTDKAVYDIVYTYLSQTGLMYRGASI